MSEDTSKTHTDNETEAAADAAPEGGQQQAVTPREIGGRGGLDPTRYGDWEKNGRCIDF